MVSLTFFNHCSPSIPLKIFGFQMFPGGCNCNIDRKWVNCLTTIVNLNSGGQSLCPVIFSSFYFPSNDSPSKTMKNFFYFIYKGYFLKIFKFLYFCLLLFFRLPLFFCFRSWSKINLKVYDIMNIQNKNLITHFVWYPEKEKKAWHRNFVHW